MVDGVGFRPLLPMQPDWARIWGLCSWVEDLGLQGPIEGLRSRGLGVEFRIRI